MLNLPFSTEIEFGTFLGASSKEQLEKVLADLDARPDVYRAPMAHIIRTELNRRFQSVGYFSRFVAFTDEQLYEPVVTSRMEPAAVMCVRGLKKYPRYGKKIYMTDRPMVASSKGGKIAKVDKKKNKNKKKAKKQQKEVPAAPTRRAAPPAGAKPIAPPAPVPLAKPTAPKATAVPTTAPAPGGNPIVPVASVAPTQKAPAPAPVVPTPTAVPTKTYALTPEANPTIPVAPIQKPVNIKQEPMEESTPAPQVNAQRAETPSTQPAPTYSVERVRNIKREVDHD